jgi:hypothetical protein
MTTIYRFGLLEAHLPEFEQEPVMPAQIGAEMLIAADF